MGNMTSLSLISRQSNLDAKTVLCRATIRNYLQTMLTGVLTADEDGETRMRKEVRMWTRALDVEVMCVRSIRA